MDGWEACFVSRTAALIVIVVSSYVVAGCGTRESTLLQSYAKGTLTPGQGLNDIHLGDPIKSFLERFGSARVSVIVGDDLLAADLHFPSYGLSFRFAADSECKSAVRVSGSAAGAMMELREPKRFLADFPACGSMSLQSIGVEGGSGAFGPAFAGQTAKGSKLHMTRAELFEHDGPGAADQSVSSVLESSDDRQFEQFLFADGLLAYVQKGDEGNPEPAAAQWKVVKMAVVSEVK